MHFFRGQKIFISNFVGKAFKQDSISLFIWEKVGRNSILAQNSTSCSLQQPLFTEPWTGNAKCWFSIHTVIQNAGPIQEANLVAYRILGLPGLSRPQRLTRVARPTRKNPSAGRVYKVRYYILEYCPTWDLSNGPGWILTQNISIMERTKSENHALWCLFSLRGGTGLRCSPTGAW